MVQDFRRMMDKTRRPTEKEILDFMDFKRDIRGRYPLDWTLRQSPWKVGKRNEPKKWITFYTYLAHKFKENNNPLY